MRIKSLVWAALCLTVAVKAQATDDLQACLNGKCPGLGHAFYLPKTNVLDTKDNSGGRAVFKDVRLGGCATLLDQQSSFRSFQTYDTNSKLTKILNGGIDTTAGIPVQQFNMDATVNITTGHENIQTETFNSVVLNIEFVNQVLNFNENSVCRSPDNLDPAFQAAFEALALPNAEQAGENFTWAAYTQFLNNWGSHFQTQQLLGSRVQQWVSSKTGSIETTDTLKAKACLKLEGLDGRGWSASPCFDIDASKRFEASKKETNDRLYITGSSAAARTELIQKFNEQNLNNFIASASQGDEPIGFSYQPLWTVLQEVYRPACGQAGKGSLACQNLQRAVALQAAYEGFGAYACGQQPDGRGAIIQTMRAQGPDSLGIYYFACHQSKTGCRENSDCVAKLNAGIAKCYCEGPSCIDAQRIPGTTLQRNYVRGTADYNFFNSDIGVNNSCEDKILSCNCDEGWSGGQLARDIWDQALSGSGGVVMASAQSETAAKAQAMDSNEVPDPTSYSLIVDVGTQPILNRSEARRAEKAARRAEESGEMKHNRVLSEPAGIDCPGRCVADFPKGTRVTLRYEENLDHQFVEWTKNECFKRKNSQDSRGKTCLIEKMNETKQVGAVFRIAPK